jgi:1-phosphofructokinase family hexose kinase
MILCITPNPAVDRTITLSHLALGHIQRAQTILVAPGGKGINVARTIRRLGGEPLCMGFVGGHNGHQLADLTQKEGLPFDWTWTDAETRICTILISQTNDATVINEPGTPVPASDWKRLVRDIGKHIPSAGPVCLSGSWPPNAGVADIQNLLEMLADSGRPVWVDTSGDALKTALAYPGLHIKVNGSEIGGALGIDVKDLDSARRALTLLVERMGSACVITLGSLGALLASPEGRWQATGPELRVVSTVGSGDAFLGGLAGARDTGKDWPDALGDAVAAGTANTLSPGGGHFSLEEFVEMRRQVRIQGW